MMKMKACLLWMFAVAAFSAGSWVHGQTPEIHFSAFSSETVKASTITWKSHFGYRKEEPNNLYILMTQGGFRAPTSENLEDLIKSWLNEHSDAEASVVFKLQPMKTDVPDSKMKCVWLVSGKDNLNVYLVRMGGLPAGTQVLNQGDDTSVTREQYEAFVKQIIASEELAKKEKLGIWKSSN